MMVDSKPPFDPDELRSALAKHRLIHSDAEIDLKAYPEAFARRRESRRWHYQINSLGQSVCHLIVGMNLSSVHDRLKTFAQVCPDLVCRPLLFWQNDNGLGHLCLEHFSGISLDALVEQGECTSDRWVALARQARALLEKTQQTSTKGNLEQELTGLMEHIGSFPGISPIDLSLLRELAVPAILRGALTEPLTTHWTNGDFCGRNLLVDTQGNLRLIDYEFSGPTHFGPTDWLRMMHFSVLPPQLDENSITELIAARQPWQEIWFWLHQLAQLGHAEPSEIVDQHLRQTVCRLFTILRKNSYSHSVASEHSLLIELLSAQHDDTRQLLDERTSWAQSLDKELREALVVRAQQIKLAEERLAWVRSVEIEQHAFKENFDRLTKEFAERTAWAKSLDAELKVALAELTTLKAACGTMGANLPDNAPPGALAILDKCQITLAELRRRLAEKNLEANTAAGAALDARLQAEAAEAEVNRLKTELNHAQLHVDHLLAQLKSSQPSVPAPTAIEPGRQAPSTS